MSKYEAKTKATSADVAAYLDSVEHDQRREDSKTICAMMERLSGEPPVMWGDSMIGFGRYHYRYDSGHEGESFRTGFAPRKGNLSLYIMPGYGAFDDIMARLGKHKTGKACLYINKLADVDMDVLEELITKSLEVMQDRYPA